jgi:hypothetical protein
MMNNPQPNPYSKVFQVVNSYFVTSFHRKREDTFRTYLTGLSFFFGFTSMGLHGVVFGPLFVSFFYTTANIVLDQYRDVLQTKFAL